jgi:hypothetical protein
MNGDRWGPEGPPLEAYSRVTNPERFALLHDIATELLQRLELEFDVERAEGYGLDPELEGRFSALARPTVVLTPREIDGAPIAISFSGFPGIHIRFGRWYTRSFPACGCDACNESAEEEAKNLKRLTESVITGCFQEAISIPDSGSASRQIQFWSAAGASEWVESALDRNEAQELIAMGQRSMSHWAPWSRRSE